MASCRDVARARMASGIEHITRCSRCGVKLFIWADIYTFEDEIWCDDCGYDYVKEHKRTLSESDIEEE